MLYYDKYKKITHYMFTSSVAFSVDIDSFTKRNTSFTCTQKIKIFAWQYIYYFFLDGMIRFCPNDFLLNCWLAILDVILLSVINSEWVRYLAGTFRYSESCDLMIHIGSRLCHKRTSYFGIHYNFILSRFLNSSGEVRWNLPREKHTTRGLPWSCLSSV